MINDRTQLLGLPLPHAENELADDVMRLREAFNALDDDAGLQTTAIQSARSTAVNALSAAHTAQQTAEHGSSAAIKALAEHDNNTTAHPNMKTLPAQQGHAGNMLTTDGTLATWTELPKTPLATPATPGLVKPGARLSVDAGGTIGVVGSDTPVGTIISRVETDDPPEGFLPCNGSRVLVIDYPELFSVLGEKFGSIEHDADGNPVSFLLPEYSGNNTQRVSTTEWIYRGDTYYNYDYGYICVDQSTQDLYVAKQGGYVEMLPNGSSTWNYINKTLGEWKYCAIDERTKDIWCGTNNTKMCVLRHGESDFAQADSVVGSCTWVHVNQINADVWCVIAGKVYKSVSGDGVFTAQTIPGSGTITCIVTDAEGAVSVSRGTIIYKKSFDSDTFTSVYTASSAITAIDVDKETGDIWAAAQAIGLVVVRNGETSGQQMYTFPNTDQVVGLRINQLTHDIWCALNNGGGVYIYNDKTSKATCVPAPLGSSYSFEIDHTKNKAYIQTYNGPNTELYALDATNLLKESVIKEGSGKHTSVAVHYATGTIYACSATAGAEKIYAKKTGSEWIDTGAPAHPWTCLVVNQQNGVVWACASDGVVSMLPQSGGTWKDMAYPQSIALTSMVVDMFSGDAFVASSSSAYVYVYRLSQKTWVQFCNTQVVVDTLSVNHARELILYGNVEGAIWSAPLSGTATSVWSKDKDAFVKSITSRLYEGDIVAAVRKTETTSPLISNILIKRAATWYPLTIESMNIWIVKVTISPFNGDIYALCEDGSVYIIKEDSDTDWSTSTNAKDYLRMTRIKEPTSGIIDFDVNFLTGDIYYTTDSNGIATLRGEDYQWISLQRRNIEFINPTVDQSTGDLYVYENSGYRKGVHRLAYEDTELQFLHSPHCSVMVSGSVMNVNSNTGDVWFVGVYGYRQGGSNQHQVFVLRKDTLFWEQMWSRFRYDGNAYPYMRIDLSNNDVYVVGCVDSINRMNKGGVSKDWTNIFTSGQTRTYNNIEIDSSTGIVYALYSSTIVSIQNNSSERQIASFQSAQRGLYLDVYSQSLYYTSHDGGSVFILYKYNLKSGSIYQKKGPHPSMLSFVGDGSYYHTLGGDTLCYQPKQFSDNHIEYPLSHTGHQIAYSMKDGTLYHISGQSYAQGIERIRIAKTVSLIKAS